MGSKQEKWDFATLVNVIQQAHDHLASHASKAVNISLTMRNWLIGQYIADYELRGADKANYGERLLDELSAAVRKANVSNAGRRQLYGYLDFYRTYPLILRTLPAQFRRMLPTHLIAEEKVRTASARFKLTAKRRTIGAFLERIQYSLYNENSEIKFDRR